LLFSPLSLHDALPIYIQRAAALDEQVAAVASLELGYRLGSIAGKLLAMVPAQRFVRMGQNIFVDALKSGADRVILIVRPVSGEEDRKSTRLNSSHRTI